MSTSLISILNMSQHSIANNQAALNVVSNNISNMNTTGYSKQSVAFSSIPAYNSYNYCSSIGSLQIGNGAQLVAINRNRAQWLDNYFREQYTEYGYYNQIGSMTNNIENLMNNELSSTGLQQKLSDFFSASQALTTDPTNNAYRIAFVEAAEDVANMLNSMSSSLQSMREQAVGTIGDPDSFDKSQIKMSVDELNDKLAQLAEINTEISKSMAGGSANNDLLDQRDVLLDEISQAMPLTITTNTNGTVNVHLGNKVLVEGGEQKLQLNAVQTDDENNPVAIQLLDMEGNVKKSDVTDQFTSGSIKAIIDSGADGELSYKSTLDEIDRIAKAFAEEMNNIQTGTADGTIPYCIDENGQLVQATEPIFVAEGGGDFTAANIKINDAILKDPKLIATARGDADMDPNAVGNTSNLERFNQLETLKIPDLSNSTPPGEGQTLSGFITSLVADIGSKVQTINEAATAQQSVATQAEEQRNAYTGVDLNQELSDLIKFQRSYEASARVFNTAADLMEIITQLGA